MFYLLTQLVFKNRGNFKHCSLIFKFLFPLFWQVEHDDCSPVNVTLGYYVTSSKTVYIPSLVVDVLNVYGFDKLLSDIRQHTPLVKAVLVPVEPWMPVPSIHLQLKTG